MDYKDFFRHWNEVNDVTIRLIQQIPMDCLDYKPNNAQFTLQELVTHIYFVEQVFAQSGQAGKLEVIDTAEVPHFRSTRDLVDYAQRVHDNTNRVFANKSNEEFERRVQTPWGQEPLFYHIHSAYEYHWHIRGQIYLYLAMLGITDLVDMYDYKREKAMV